MPGNDNKPSLAGAIALIVIGLLILVPSGLCTGIGVILSVSDAMGSRGVEWTTLQMVLAVGAPFVLVGGLLLVLGVQMMRRRRARDRAKDDPGAF